MIHNQHLGICLVPAMPWAAVHGSPPASLPTRQGKSGSWWV
jgi:hypothetical protein